MLDDLRVLLEDLVAPRNAQIDDALGDEDGDIRGIRKDDAAPRIAADTEEPTPGDPKSEPGPLQQLERGFA